MSDKLEECRKALEASDDYRVIQRLRRQDAYNPDDGEKKFTAIYLDVETTGMNSDEDEIIELAMISFEFSSTGKIFRITGEYNELNDPGVPISAEITRITGITDDMVAGHAIDLEKVNAMIRECDLVIAHNSGFDRPFVENLTSEFEKKPWGCSIADIGWRDEGLESAKLEYLAYRYGYFYEGHRATIDCIAGIHLLTQVLPESGKLAMEKLLEQTRQSQYRIWAEYAPFEKKDLLKERGYRWSSGDDGKPKAWWKDVSESEKQAELDYLASSIYGKMPAHLPEAKISAFNRYSKRI